MVWGKLIRNKKNLDIQKLFDEANLDTKPQDLNISDEFLTIGVKKRITEMNIENKKIVSNLRLNDIQKIFDRLLLDVQNTEKWNDISIDMVLTDRSKLISL